MTKFFSDNFNQKQSLEILVNVIEKGYLGLRQEKKMRGGGGSVGAVSIADPTVLIVAPPR